VLWTIFCEYEHTKPKKTKRRFAREESKPLSFFAGIWTSGNGVRGSIKTRREGERFLTCDSDSIVGLIHLKATPVVLTTEEELGLDARPVERGLGSSTAASG
jgi:putative SOS response-associated peptidase YedK